MRWLARDFEFSFPRPALVMGIVNVTPDSFADGGRFFEPEVAIKHGLELIKQGAEILDVGGESTRPGAKPVSEKEEKRRVLPVIEALAAHGEVPISIDTMKAEVAQAALQAGASIINDVGALRTDSTMWKVAAEARAGYVCMHMQCNPETMQARPAYRDVVAEVRDFFEERLKRICGEGMSNDQVVLDPGFGFGKTRSHNLQLLAGLRSFTTLERPLLIGVSRKSFIGKEAGADVADRLPGSLACACWAVNAGTFIIRAHDVAETVQALRMTEAILAHKE